MKKHLTLFLILFIATVLFSQPEGALKLNDGWKFQPGDDVNYSKPIYDDSNWKPIEITKIWDYQGYDKLDGYAWYRIRFVIPSSLKESSLLKDSLKIFLGRIDDYDQTFLNGKIIGVNGRKTFVFNSNDFSFTKEEPIPWAKDRRYTLGVDDPRILWDKENVIAVRVYDQGGAGGMYTGAYIGMSQALEYLSINYKEIPFVNKNGSQSKKFSVTNNSASLILKGTFTISALNKLTEKSYFVKKSKLILAPNSSSEFSVSVKNHDQSTKITYTFELDNSKEKISYSEETAYILTPKPSDKPRINSAKVFGARPNNPFLFKVAATGKAPLTYEAKNLPQGLSIDKSTGIITGKVSERGEYKVALTVKNKLGTANSELKIKIGNEIALTPPMGWNSWNCWGLAVDQQKVIASARTFVQKGLVNHGWTYINIDDGWEIEGSLPEPKRDAAGTILVNNKFPNMKAIGDTLHSLGLKFGIYSSPGTVTCGNYTGSYKHELKDAQLYGFWGIDYLKYDWCSYGEIAKDNSLEELMKPYFVMRKALNQVDRDIVYSLCQYGMGKVWEWGETVGGDSWRTTGDITDTWKSMSDIGFSQVENAKYAKPSNWNDPDMLVVGWVGWGPRLHPTRLTPDEQYTHISLWCLLSSPLLIGCDLTRLDDFTLNLLTNDEVIALNQDPLGKQATPIIKQGNFQVWMKELEDGTKAIGIFNLGEETEKYQLNFSEINLSSKLKLRDLWRQKNLGESKDKFETLIPSHGVVLIKTL